MAENEKYNIKTELLEADKRLYHSNALLGKSVLTIPQYSNAMRTTMFTSHLNQFMTMNHSQFPGVFTNGENVVGKHSSGYKQVKHDSVVFRKVVKFEGIDKQEMNYELFLFNEKKKQYEVYHRRECEDLQEVFGFSYDNSVIDSLQEGDEIKKGTVLYKSHSYDENMNYGYGINIPIMFTTDPFTSEDAAVAAKSLDEAMASQEVVTLNIGVNQNEFLLNRYGDEERYQPLPEIGQLCEGEAVIKRTVYNDRKLSEFKDSALRHMTDADIPYFANGTVVDIDVFCNTDTLEDNPFNEQVIKYYKSQMKYYQELEEVCEEIMSSGFKYTKEIDYTYKRVREFLDEESKWRDNDSVFNNYKLRIRVMGTTGLQVGQKVTGRWGNKSVISKVVPDDEMPYYYNERGEKVVIKLLINILSVVNRTIAFAIFEPTINFICNRVRDELWKLDSFKKQEDLLFSVLKDFNKKYYNHIKEDYDKSTKQEKKEFIQDIINHRLYIEQEPMYEEEPIFYRLVKIYEKYDFLKPYDIYIKKWGREIKTLNPMYAGEMYIIKLKQTSRKGFSARSTGAINTKGLPERSYRNKAHTEITSSTPIRFGEFEVLNFSIGMLPEEIQLFELMYRTSEKGRRELAEQILLGNDTFEISSSYTSRVSEIFSVILKSLGLRIDFVDEDKEVREYDDSEICTWEYEGREYLCTEYQFMLVKRKKEVEKEVLHKYGMLDKADLEEKVMDIMKKRCFVTGPSKEEYDHVPAFLPETVPL